MNNKNKIIIVLSILVFIFSFFVCYLLVNKNKKIEFYARVKESYLAFSLVEPLHNEEIFKDFPVLQIDVGNLKSGDLIKVSADSRFIETYPPVAKVDHYEFIINNAAGKKEEIMEVTTTSKMITKKSVMPKTSTALVRSTKILTTTAKIENAITSQKALVKPKTTVLSKSDDIVISNLENKVLSIQKNQNNSSFGEKAKSYFIDTIDFIFYNKDIKGVYFKDLTSKAKLTVISLALKLDNLVDKHYPNYKDNINSSYRNAKSKLIELYLDKTTDYCSKEKNDGVCAQAKRDFQDFKNSYGISWEFIKDLGNKGLSKLKEWYEVYSGK